MAEQPAAASSTQSSNATLINPKDALCSITGALSGYVEDVVVESPQITTTADALKKVSDALTDSKRHRSVMITKARTRDRRLKIQKFAKEASSSSPDPLKIRKSIPASDITSPKRPSTAHTQKLKENFLPLQPQNDPYILVKAKLDERKLAALSGAINVSAIDAESSDPEILLRSDYCLWDSGAHLSIISDDLIQEQSPSFLDDDIHAPYRQANGVGIQMSGVFKFSNIEVNIAAIFFVTPLQRIPNQRSGIILGQSAFMDRMVFESIPRAILQKRGEIVKDGEWGDINIKAYLNEDDEMLEESA